ncbi:hypothetical protein EPI10_015388 [Gossypium australe]|uniref:Uncharacterized protein n=1 Tax=Gossypium australe TaxID=47621 RepID=A0A5B6VKT5_9ROSI|nr:hypothetical protein EPI10_015388 [Gossypium australe]
MPFCNSIELGSVVCLSKSLYPLLTEHSPKGSPLQTTKSPCSTKAKGIFKILFASSSEKLLGSKHHPQ